jgi:hypothetical protein
MSNSQNLDWQLVGSVVGGALAIGLLLLFWRWYRRRRQAAVVRAAMTGGAYEHMRSVLLPDAQGLMLHVDYALLTARGIVLIDYREMRGNIFGGDQMTEWTVMDGPRRYTVINPQSALYDRIAAVRALAPEIPIEGRIVFGRRARFPKGLPSHTCNLAAIAADFPASDRQAAGPLPDSWMGEWAVVRGASKPSDVAINNSFFSGY